jgi:signal transduction histidine kinase
MLLSVMTVIGLVGAFANLVVNRQFAAYIAGQEIARSENIAHDLSGQWDASARTWNTEYIHAVGMYSLYDGYILKVRDADGDTVWDAEDHDMTLCGQIMSDISVRMDSVRASGDFAAHTFDLVHGGQKIGSVSINYYGPYFYSESDFHFITALNTVLIYIGAAAFAVSIAAGLFLARRIARPISKTAEAAKRISMGDYSVRLGDSTNTRELHDLASAIDHLSAALAEQESLRLRLTADAAHELRTPLTSVGSHLEAMIEGIWEPSKERLRSCHEEILRLGNLVGDLGQLAIADREDLKLNLSHVDLLDVVKGASPVWEAAASRQGIDISVCGASAIVLADGERLTQVVTNLLSNAVKYTAKNGRIDISVFPEEGNGVIEIRDDGIGIPENDLPFIFERFYRTDKSRSRDSGGAGIGLAIVSSIVAAHGGAATAESENGKGSCFTVTIPLLRNC